MLSEAGERTREALVASGYFRREVIRIPPELVARLLKFCEEKALLLVCDFNDHHKVGGSSDTDRRGEHPLEFISSNNKKYGIWGDITLGNTLINELVKNCGYDR